MKKRLMSVLFLFLAINIVYALEIDSKVQEQLNNNQEVSVIVLLENKENFNIQNNVLSNLDNDEFKIKNKFTSTKGFSGKVNKNGFEKLKNNPDIKNIFLDEKLKLNLQDSTKLINSSLVNTFKLNGMNLTGASQTICILDTGIEYTHESFDSCILTDLQNGNCGKIVNGTDFVNSDNDPLDDNGHGTHVAGIAAANGSIIGVAPFASIATIKVCDSSGDCLLSNIISGIDWCSEYKDIYNISVISMSFGSGNYDNTNCPNSLDDTIANAFNKGISLVASSGNTGNLTGIALPACNENVTAVGSITKTETISSFTDRGPLLSLLAPGSSILSTYTSNSTNTQSGTSMAAPHVSGAIAILKQFNSSLLPREIESTLNNTGRLLEDLDSGLNYTIIDLFKAIVSLDTIKPIITLDILNNSFINSNDFNFTVQDATIDNCSLYSDFNGDFLLNETLDLSVEGSYNFSIKINDGSYNYSVSCVDHANNLNFSENFTINIDRIIPIIIEDISLNKAELSIDNVHINWSVIDLNLDDTFINVTYPNGTLFGKFNENTTLTTDNIIEAGNYTILFYANDSANNINTTNFTVEFINTIPELIINYPKNITYNFNESLDLNFTMLNNYTNIWYNLDNNNITITDNITFDTGEGEHTLYLFVNNSFGKENSSFVSFIVDLTNPIVNLISPSNNENSTDDDITFEYNVIDFSIANCSLYLNDNIDQTDSSITTDVTQSFSKNDMSNGDYNWSISCIDYGDLQGNSSTFSLNINKTSSDTSSGDGSSGGGGGTGAEGGASVSQDTAIETQTSREVKNFDINFKEKDEDSFNVIKDDSIKFTIKGNDHTVIIDSITSDSVTMTISSDPITITLTIAESKQVDLDKDEVNDLEITLIDILDNEAFVKFRILESEKILTEEGNKTALGITGATVKEGEGRLSKTLIVIIITLAVLGILGYFKRDFISRKIIEIKYKIKYR